MILQHPVVYDGIYISGLYICGRLLPTCYYRNKVKWRIFLLSVHWPTFYISVLHAVMMVESLTPLPYVLLAYYTLA